jgi:hypothetical protein
MSDEPVNNTPRALDFIGRPLARGDLVEMVTPAPTNWVVMDVGFVVTNNGRVTQLKLEAQAVATGEANRPIGNLRRIAIAEECQASTREQQAAQAEAQRRVVMPPSGWRPS